MKLLLTSAGIRNRSLAKALNELTGKSAADTKLGFVPTAIVESSNKDWAIKQFLDLWRFGYNWVDIIDPSADDSDWQNRLAAVDVIYISGGNTFHLLDQSRKTGFDKWLNDNLSGKVYVGGSASSVIATPTVELASLPPGDENLPGLEDLTGFNWVEFEIMPHCDKDQFAVVEKYAAAKPYPVYAIDDETAIKVDGDKIEVISEGSWKLYEPK